MHANRSVHFRKRRVLLAAAVGSTSDIASPRRILPSSVTLVAESSPPTLCARSDVHHVALVVPFRAVVVKSIELRVARRRNNVRADVTKLHHFVVVVKIEAVLGVVFSTKGCSSLLVLKATCSPPRRQKTRTTCRRLCRPRDPDLCLLLLLLLG